MKAETLSAVHQADLAQASGKGALHGSRDAGVAELANALNALSLDVQEAAQGSGVQDKELAEVLVNLQIVPGQPAHKAAIDAVQAWTGLLEEQEEFATALLHDSQDELMARVDKTYVVENPSDDEPDDGETVESTGEGRHHHTQNFHLFGPLEHFVQSSCGNDGAGNLSRRARMSFIRDFASKPRRQADMREFAQA